MKFLTLSNFDDDDDNEVIEVLRTDNIVSLKKKLNNRLYGDEKSMVLYSLDKTTILENNIFVPDDLSKIYYLQTEDEESDDIILYIKRNFCGVPKYLQYHKSMTIQNLKNNISALFHPSETIHLFNEDGNILEDGNTLEECKLQDYSKIKIWQGNSLNVSVKILDPLEKENLNRVKRQMDICVTETIQEIKQKINNIGKYENLQLFSTSAFLEDGKQLMYYPIINNSEIFFLDMKKKRSVTITDKIRDGKYAKISRGYLDMPNENCVIFEYDISRSNIKNFKMLKYEMITRLKLPYDTSRFVQMLSMFEEANVVYIAMESLKGSLRSLLHVDMPPLTENQIKKYNYEIIDGLAYMHKLQILHRNLNCGSVLIDDNGNAKLCNFHLSKFLFDCTTEQLLKGLKGSKLDDDECWVAPEVLIGESYGFKSDIWSFGVTMLEMMTRTRPYPELNNVQAAHRIIGARRIEFPRNLYPNSGFDEILDKCLQSMQTDRPNAWDLRRILHNPKV